MLCIKEKRRKRRKFCKHGGWLTFVNYYKIIIHESGFMMMFTQSSNQINQRERERRRKEIKSAL
jgi:hypothetical protein